MACSWSWRGSVDLLDDLATRRLRADARSSTATSGSTAARCSAWCRRRCGRSGRPADERNRITLAMRPLLVRGERLMIIDAGCGDKMDAKSADIYGFDRRENLDVTLARAGVRAERHRARARLAPALRSRRRFHRARRIGRGRAALPQRAVPRSTTASGRMRRIRTSGTARAIFAENYVPLRGGRRRRSSAGRRGRRRPASASGEPAATPGSTRSSTSSRAGRPRSSRRT